MNKTKELPLTSQIESELFLFVYSDWYDTYSELATLDRIADTIGFSDCTDFHSFKIYRICKNSVREIDYRSQLTGCNVFFFDGDDRIAVCEYDEH